MGVHRVRLGGDLRGDRGGEVGVVAQRRSQLVEGVQGCRRGVDQGSQLGSQLGLGGEGRGVDRRGESLSLIAGDLGLVAEAEGVGPCEDGCAPRCISLSSILGSGHSARRSGGRRGGGSVAVREGVGLGAGGFVAEDLRLSPSGAGGSRLSGSPIGFRGGGRKGVLSGVPSGFRSGDRAGARSGQQADLVLETGR